jgi:hypothetical protein
MEYLISNIQLNYKMRWNSFCLSTIKNVSGLSYFPLVVQAVVTLKRLPILETLTKGIPLLNIITHTTAWERENGGRKKKKKNSIGRVRRTWERGNNFIDYRH